MKNIFYITLLTLWSVNFLFSTTSEKITIVGSGIVGALESYYAYQDAQKRGENVRITVYEKSPLLANSQTNTAFNIAPSLTIDEILSVVPRGSEMVQKLGLLFSEPGGIRVDDVQGVNDSESAMRFKEQVAIYGQDLNHEDRTETLLNLGKMSMNLWQKMYDDADDELKNILVESNFNPCREITQEKTLHDGYRIDLIYGIPNAYKRAVAMKETYEKFGYKNCKILSPDEVVEIDPSLSDFCNDRSTPSIVRTWKDDCVALWRPGGCIDTGVFLPKFYEYLKKKMGSFQNKSGKTKDYFRLRFNKEVIGVEFDKNPKIARIVGLKFSDGTIIIDRDSTFVFCPGEAIGSLKKFGFTEPAYAGFAGPLIKLNIPLSHEQRKQYQHFSHCMEVHKEGIVLAWQARLKDDKIYIGVAGTKAFYGDKMPRKDEAFATNRNLVQLNMINDVLPEFVSLALGSDTKGKELTFLELQSLEEKGILQRWVGRRACAYDGFPTLGSLYMNGQKVINARCTTHLGSGGVSFSHAAVHVSRSVEQPDEDPFIKKVLHYADTRRKAEDGLLRN